MPIKEILATVLAIIAVSGSIVGAKEYFISKAEASGMLVSNERANIETELRLIDLELSVLEGEYGDLQTSEKAEKKRNKRIEYLEHRQKILESRLMELKNK
jgi:hypothetical protein